ncbi:MAG: PstS family phosphate ABC transporter substrate-binding protein [Bacteroidales bacterium]
MKKYNSFIILQLALISLLLFNSCHNKHNEKYISISGAFALYPLTVKWAEEYEKQHPGVIIDVSAGGAGKGMTDVLSGMVDVAMFSREVSQVEISKGALGLAVARDAVVPILNAGNPNIDNILRQGITNSQFVDLFVNNKISNWNQIIPSAKADNISVYTRSDACGAGEIWAEYLNSKQELMSGIGIFGDPGVVDAVKNDKFGIGYSNIIYAYDARTRKTYQGIVVIPIDFNNNGQIDTDESIYSSLDTLMNAIAKEKYPSPPARDLYFITKGKPVKKITSDFLNWILTDGQKYIKDAGYMQLTPEKVAEQKVKFSN